LTFDTDGEIIVLLARTKLLPAELKLLSPFFSFAFFILFIRSCLPRIRNS
jgi:hypothetical protein